SACRSRRRLPIEPRGARGTRGNPRERKREGESGMIQDTGIELPISLAFPRFPPWFNCVLLLAFAENPLGYSSGSSHPQLQEVRMRHLQRKAFGMLELL